MSGLQRWCDDSSSRLVAAVPSVDLAAKCSHSAGNLGRWEVTANPPQWWQQWRCKKKKKLYVATEDIKADIKASEVRKSSPAHVVQKDLQMGHECHKPSPSCPPVHEKHDGKWN